MILHSYYKTLMMTFCIENKSNRNNDWMNCNRSNSLLRSNRPLTWLYNLLQQVFKVLKLAFELKTQFYNFFLYFVNYFVLFLYFNDFFYFPVRGKKVKANENSSRVCGSRVKTIPLCLLGNSLLNTKIHRIF